MFLIISCLMAFLGSLFSFADTASSAANGNGYVSIPQVVRDYYSKEVMFQAQPRCRFMQFAKKKVDLQAARAKAMVFVKYNNLAGGGKLLESDTLVPKGISASEVIIPVYEQANAIQLTEMLVRTSVTDILGDASKLLGNNVAVVLDQQFRDTVLGTTNIVYGGGKGSAGSLLTGDGLDSDTVMNAVEVLQTNNAPRINNDQGDFYVCVAHPHQLAQLRRDPNWINANTYMGRRQLYVGEVGMYAGVIFIDSTNMGTLTNAEAAAAYGSFAPATGWQASFMGDNAFAWAVALELELRDDGVVELGRKHTLGWYGIWGTGILESKNIVKALTA